MSTRYAPSRFWVLEGEVPQGPLAQHDLLQLYQSGKLGRDTLICPEGGTSWRPIQLVLPVPVNSADCPADTTPKQSNVLSLDDCQPLPLTEVGRGRQAQARDNGTPGRLSVNADLGRTGGYVDYDQVPWLRRSRVMSRFLLLGLVFGPLLLVVSVVALSGGIYYDRRCEDGTLAQWSSANKVAAVVILIVYAITVYRGFVDT